MTKIRPERRSKEAGAGDLDRVVHEQVDPSARRKFALAIDHVGERAAIGSDPGLASFWLLAFPTLSASSSHPEQTLEDRRNVRPAS